LIVDLVCVVVAAIALPGYFNVQRVLGNLDCSVCSGWVYMYGYFCYDTIPVRVFIVLQVGTPTSAAWSVFVVVMACFLSFGMIGCG
jgi:hypothetical protein